MNIFQRAILVSGAAIIYWMIFQSSQENYIAFTMTSLVKIAAIVVIAGMLVLALKGKDKNHGNKSEDA